MNEKSTPFSGTQRRSELVGRLTLITVSMALTLFAAEFVLETVYPLHGITLTLDDRCHFKLIPNATKVFTHRPENGGESILVRINSRGFRGDEFEPRKSAPRIVVYGDSFIYGEFSRLEDTFAHQLQAGLGEDRREPVEVINAGVYAFGPDQVSRRLGPELDLLRPDVLIVAIFSGNDYGDLLRNKIYRLDAHDDLVENDYRIAPGLRRQLDPDSLMNRFAIVRNVRVLAWRLKARVDSWRRRQDDVASNDAVQSWLDARVTEYVEYVVEQDNEVKSLFHDHYDADVSVSPNASSSVYKKRLMEGVIVRIRTIAEQRRVPLLLVFIPSPLDVCVDYDYKVNRSRFEGYGRRNLIDPLVDIAGRHGIAYVDLFDDFHRNGADGFYFRSGDNHWNAAGQQRAAEVVKDFIVREGLLPGNGVGVTGESPARERCSEDREHPDPDGGICPPGTK